MDQSNLSQSELACAELFVIGMPLMEIAKALGIHFTSVEYHLINIQRKLQCQTREELSSKLKETLLEEEKN